MAYTKQTWTATETLLAASRFNHMEDGISGAASDATSALTNSSQNRLMIAPAWVSGGSYTQGDVVTYNGWLKACNITGTRNSPADTSSWSTVTVASLYSSTRNSLTFDTTPRIGSSNPVTSNGIYTALQGKQAALTFDTTPTANSTKPVTSGGVYTALAAKQNALTFDSTPTSGSSRPVTSNGVYVALATKQNALTFDTTPTADSTKPVTSGGVYTALAAKQNALTFDSTPTSGSSRPVTSNGVYVAINAVSQSLSAKSISVDENKDQLVIVF